MAITEEQGQDILQQRSDVAADPYYSQNPGEWYQKHGVNEGFKLLGTTPQTVYSANNLASATTGVTPAPDDLLGIRNQIYNELGVTQKNQEYQDIYKKLNEFDTASEAQQVGLEGQTVSLNVIRGEQAEAGRQRALSRGSLARQADVALNALTAARGEANDVFNIRSQEVTEKRQLMYQNPGAGIKFGDSYNTVADKLYKYQTKQATKNLFQQTFGYTPSNMSNKEMEKKLKKQYKSAKEYEKQKEALANEYTQAQIGNLNATAAKKSSSGSSKGGSSKKGYTASKTVATDTSGYDYYKLGSKGQKVKISRMQYENLQKKEERKKKKKTTNRSV